MSIATQRPEARTTVSANGCFVSCLTLRQTFTSAPCDSSHSISAPFMCVLTEARDTLSL
jgi:hypothetical protein